MTAVDEGGYDYDVMYSVNAKTEPAGSLSPRITAQSVGSFTGSTINIASYLEFVNEYFPDILPMSVLNHFGHKSRPNGTHGKEVKYQWRDPNAVKVTRALRKENDNLKTDIVRLKELRCVYIYSKQ